MSVDRSEREEQNKHVEEQVSKRATHDPRAAPMSEDATGVLDRISQGGDRRNDGKRASRPSRLSGSTTPCQEITNPVSERISSAKTTANHPQLRRSRSSSACLSAGISLITRYAAIE
jgi:hypothetical protein